MAEKKAKRTQYTTPRGVFVFPKLAEPDTKFKKEGEYSVKVRFGGEAAEKMIAMLSEQHSSAIAAGHEEFKKLPVATRKKLKAVTENPFYQPVYDKDTEEETGEIEVRFTAKASGEKKDTKKKWKRGPITAFDASGKPFKSVDKVWSGTEGKVSFTTNPYFIPGTGATGLSLGLEAVQVLQLAGPGQRSASAYGFEAEDDGFDASEIDAQAKADDEAGDDAGGDADEASDF